MVFFPDLLLESQWTLHVILYPCCNVALKLKTFLTKYFCSVSGGYVDRDKFSKTKSDLITGGPGIEVLGGRSFT